MGGGTGALRIVLAFRLVLLATVLQDFEVICAALPTELEDGNTCGACCNIALFLRLLHAGALATLWTAAGELLHILSRSLLGLSMS
jgi:hypothetical protein